MMALVTDLGLSIPPKFYFESLTDIWRETSLMELHSFSLTSRHSSRQLMLGGGDFVSFFLTQGPEFLH